MNTTTKNTTTTKMTTCRCQPDWDLRCGCFPPSMDEAQTYVKTYRRDLFWNKKPAEAHHRKLREKLEEQEEEEEESDDEEEEEGDWCYGVGEAAIIKTFVMAGGGSHWWNYVVEFNKDDNQEQVWIESQAGREHTDKTLFVCENMLLLEYPHLVDTSKWSNLHNW